MGPRKILSTLHHLIAPFARGYLIGCGIVTGILTTALMAATISGSINVFSAGETVSSAKINENFTSLKAAIEGLPLGLYCGRTTGTYTGAMGGYAAAKALCETACGNTNAHMCTAHEMVMSSQRGVSIDATDMWYASGTHGEVNNGLNVINDCTSAAGSFSSTTPYYAAIWDGISAPSLAACTTSLPIACCL